MSLEKLHGRKRQPWEPTREFWFSDIRSGALREINLAIANHVLDLLHDPEVMQDTERQHELYTKLEYLNGLLIEMGISPDMQTDFPVEVYYKDPVIAAEWIAGQLIQFTGKRLVSEQEAQPIISELVDGQFGVLESEPPEKMWSYFDASMIVGGMRTLLDPADEELSDFWRHRRSH